MGLFERKRFVWNEPWFFQQRIRSRKGWLLFSLLLLAVAVAVGAALYFAAPAGRLPLLEILGLSGGLAAAVWWVLDGVNTRRQAVLFEDSLVVGGDMGKYSQPITYKLSGISSAAIVMPEESKWPERALFFLYEGEEQGIGIESKASLAKLAQAIHDAGVPVRLHGWQPNQDSEFAKAFSWQADPRDVVEKAKIETLPPGSPSMMTVGGILLAIVRQSWAIALWLLLTGAAVYYGYYHWRNLGLVEVVLLFAIPIGAMYIAAQFTDRFACASTSRGLTRMARKQIRKRDGIQLDPDAHDLIPVEIFFRDQFDKSIQKIHEMGFLQADQRGRRVLFEGKKERWYIPAGSIRSLAIEEVQVGTPGQSATGALNYYVVVRFAADEEREFGFRHAERDFGEFNDVKRAEGGIRVFEAFEPLLSRIDLGEVSQR
jgi:hypothetical protein